MTLSRLSELLDGLRIPGGCQDCNAYQTMTKQDGIYVINIFHDDTCPEWRRRDTPSRRTP